jgi:PAS domain S-box-containing protein
MESLELSQSLLESSTDCIKLLDLDAHLLFMNGGGCKTLAIDDFSRVANVYWLDFWKGTDASAARAAFEMAKAGGIGHFQGYCPTWKGTPKCWDVVITPIFGAHGKPERLLAISRDITEARQAEDELRATLESIGDGFVAFDAEWRFLYVNQPAERLSRKRREELLGRNFWELFPLMMGTNVEREFRRVAAGEMREFENFYEPCGCWFQNRCYPRAGGGISVYFQDITERKRSQDDLRQALQQLQFITENMEAGVTRCSRDLRYLWVSRNYAAWLGRTIEEIEGRPILDVLGPSGYEGIRPHVENVLSGNRQEYEAQVNFSGIGPRWIHAVYIPTRGVDDKVEGWIAIVTDVTDVRRAREESFARQKLESVGTLAGGIAHDFNNLLGGVLAQAELGLGELATGSNPAEELKNIRNIAIRGSEIVRQLMIYAGRESEAVGLVDISQIVEEMIELLKVSISKHARLEADLGQDLGAVRTSAAQLRQIVMNLVMNASEAIGGQDGVIRVTTRRTKVNRDSSGSISDHLAEGGYVQIEVSDTGCGMSQETLARIFDPFFSTKAAGHGLGLAVVDGIVRNLDGTIHVSSESGRGTTFQILLHCAEATAGASNSLTSDLVESARTQECTVLVVEDEDPLRQAVVKVLRKTGFVVLEATNGSAAIDLLHTTKGKIDVILLDMTIPGASSQEVVAEAAQARPDVRVILTSAYGQERLTLPMSALQISGFIRKPFQLGDLVKILSRSASGA